jgi:excisionase family DNA binding protein
MPSRANGWTPLTDDEAHMADEMKASGAEPLWDVRDVARYLRTSRSWTYKAAERNIIPSVRIGSLLRFEPKAIREFVAELSRKDAP